MSKKKCNDCGAPTHLGYYSPPDALPVHAKSWVDGVHAAYWLVYDLFERAAEENTADGDRIAAALDLVAEKLKALAKKRAR